MPQDSEVMLKKLGFYQLCFEGGTLEENNLFFLLNTVMAQKRKNA